MKKIFTKILSLSIVFISVFSFAACKKPKTCTVTFVMNEKTYTLEKNIGDKVSFDEFIANFVDTNLDTGAVILGLYTDKDCAIKYDEDIALTGDTTLYIDWRVNANVCKITFVYENKEYKILRNAGQALKPDDFVISAYGKGGKAEDFSFYKDEAMTEPVDLTTVVIEENQLKAKYWVKKT